MVSPPHHGGRRHGPELHPALPVSRCTASALARHRSTCSAARCTPHSTFLAPCTRCHPRCTHLQGSGTQTLPNRELRLQIRLTQLHTSPAGSPPPHPTRKKPNNSTSSFAEVALRIAVPPPTYTCTHHHHLASLHHPLPAPPTTTCPVNPRKPSCRHPAGRRRSAIKRHSMAATMTNVSATMGEAPAEAITAHPHKASLPAGPEATAAALKSRERPLPHRPSLQRHSIPTLQVPTTAPGPPHPAPACPATAMPDRNTRECSAQGRSGRCSGWGHV